MHTPKGFLFSGINCGIKKKNKDLGLIYCQDLSRAIGFFTTNSNPSYSVILCKKNIKNPIKAILVNSGNANCYSHKEGLKDSNKIITELAKQLNVKKDNILLVSTGIIGKKLPKDKIVESIPGLIGKLDRNIDNFSESIITTDTFKKVSSVNIGGAKNKAGIIGFSKGAGMIYPNLATMLGFILTDLDVPSGIFRKIAREAVEESFNSISIDGCLSTNDTVLFLSSKKTPLINKSQLSSFVKGLKMVCLDLAKKIVKDGEGASKFIAITIKGAKTKQEAKKGAFSLANSNLFKTALYGANSNWGRIISALGQVGIKVKENIVIKSTSLKKKDVKLSVDLKRGRADWTVYTCDLTPEYVKINAEYS